MLPIETAVIRLPTLRGALGLGIFRAHVSLRLDHLWQRRPAAQAVLDLVGCSVVGVDRKKLGLDAAAKDASAGISCGAR